MTDIKSHRSAGDTKYSTNSSLERKGNENIYWAYEETAMIILKKLQSGGGGGGKSAVGRINVLCVQASVRDCRSRAGRAASRKMAPCFTLANKQKSLTLKNILSLLNLYD